MDHGTMGTLWRTVARIPRVNWKSKGTSSFVSELQPRFMLGRTCQATFLVALFLTSLGLGVVESSIQLDETPTQQRSQGANSVVDVPSWRIGDEWVYETRFDVAQLLAQLPHQLREGAGWLSNRATET